MPSLLPHRAEVPHSADTVCAPADAGPGGRTRRTWGSSLRWRPSLTELEEHDVVQTLVVRHRAAGSAVTDAEIQQTVARQVGVRALRGGDLGRLRSALLDAGCRLAG
jgi:hypothetical protein